MNTKYKINKNTNLKLEFFKVSKLVILAVIFLFNTACNDEECEFDEREIALTPGVISCAPVSVLNLSTGVDVEGNVIEAAYGAQDPFWRILNNPPNITSGVNLPCSDPILDSFSGLGYVVSLDDGGVDSWVDLEGASAIAPFDLGPDGDTYNCDVPFSLPITNLIKVPYVFERSFCMSSDASVDFSLTYTGTQEVSLKLIDNVTNSVLDTSPAFGSMGVFQTWSVSGLSLTAGSYSVRAELIKNSRTGRLGFSVLGDITIANGDLALTNNLEGCCDNNVISVLAISESDCDRSFNSREDTVASWKINLFNSLGEDISSGATDINGNFFFSGLADGTYTIEVRAGAAYAEPLITETVTVLNNEVKIVEFYNCQL